MLAEEAQRLALCGPERRPVFFFAAWRKENSSAQARDWDADRRKKTVQ
jgi:hypothetical protein